MERVISLFREPDYERWSPSDPNPPPAPLEEPLYFRQLLAHLHEQKEQAAREQRAARPREPRPVDPRPVDPRPVDPRPRESRPREPLQREPRPRAMRQRGVVESPA